jgi:hypothetical protein
MNTMERTKPVVGNGAHMSNGVDTHSMTIIMVSESGKTVITQRDSVKPVEGSSSYSNEWEMTPNPNGATYEFSLRKNGLYVQAGDSMNFGSVLHISGRREYYSYEF